MVQLQKDLKKYKNLKNKLDQLIEDGLWELCELLPQVESNSESSNIKDCIICYFCGYVSKQILKKKTCTECISFLRSRNADHPAAELFFFKN